MSETTTTPTTLPPLWPQPIPVIGLTGTIGTGKTTFGLLIDPQRTLIYDEENSSASYASFGMTRVDVHAELQRKFPKGYKPIAAFNWWLDHVRSQPAGKWRVIMVDTIGLIENGLVDWVEANPQHFGHTAAQHKAQNGAMKWGDVSKFWKLVLLDIAARCESFVFTTHMTDIRKDGEATGKMKPKGNKVLMEIASLFLELERKPDAGGNVPQKPAAKVVKSRLNTPPVLNPQTGELETFRILPPRIPVATPHAIRQYFAKPAGDKLGAGELAPEERMTDDERLQLQAQRARDEMHAEKLKLERESRRGGARTAEDGGPLLTSSRTTAAAAAPPSPQQTPPSQTPAFGPTPEQLETIAELRELMCAAKGIPADDQAARTAAWKAVLAPAGVTTVMDLAAADVAELIKELQRVFDPFAAGAPKPPPPSST